MHDDWATIAAQGVINDLMGRSEIGNTLENIDDDIRSEIIADLANIIYRAKDKHDDSVQRLNAQLRLIETRLSNTNKALETTLNQIESILFPGDPKGWEYPMQVVQRVKDFLSFHPIAVKLMRERTNFVVVSEKEPYFSYVYSTIRSHEMNKGTWTEDDERRYREVLGWRWA